MCAAEGTAKNDAADTGASAAGRRAMQRYGTIVVIGGGCYGAYYVRQLLRARQAGAVTWTRVAVVDRDAACRVARERTAASADQPWDGIEVVTAEWSAFFRTYFAEATSYRERFETDAIVPSPLMPHLMLEWLRGRARERWPERAVGTVPLARAPNIPWQRSGADGAHFVSFAEWMCPINCIEPPLCPHIAGPRTWSMPRAARAYVAEERRTGRPLAGPVIFHCTHRVYGVGMFDTRDVLVADDVVCAAAARSAAEILVGTMSHCHGVFEVLSVAAPHPGSVGERRA